MRPCNIRGTVTSFGGFTFTICCERFACAHRRQVALRARITSLKPFVDEDEYCEGMDSC